MASVSASFSPSSEVPENTVVKEAADLFSTVASFYGFASRATDLLGVRTEELQANVDDMRELTERNREKECTKRHTNAVRSTSTCTTNELISNLYGQCRPPPSLHQFDSLRTDGKTTLTFYTNPAMCRQKWQQEMLTVIQRRKEELRSVKKRRPSVVPQHALCQPKLPVGGQNAHYDVTIATRSIYQENLQPGQYKYMPDAMAYPELCVNQAALLGGKTPRPLPAVQPSGPLVRPGTETEVTLKRASIPSSYAAPVSAAQALGSSRLSGIDQRRSSKAFPDPFSRLTLPPTPPPPPHKDTRKIALERQQQAVDEAQTRLSRLGLNHTPKHPRSSPCSDHTVAELLARRAAVEYSYGDEEGEDEPEEQREQTLSSACG